MNYLNSKRFLLENLTIGSIIRKMSNRKYSTSTEHIKICVDRLRGQTIFQKILQNFL